GVVIRISGGAGEAEVDRDVLTRDGRKRGRDGRHAGVLRDRTTGQSERHRRTGEDPAERIASIQPAAGGDLAVERWERVDAAEDRVADLCGRGVWRDGPRQRGDAGNIWRGHAGPA